eukprot:TRINITY_DN13108_c0_g1_i1.p1 TRINITY_DN13108_c0_g1~~TRINITY_DN13108_c0_g1_i1.p1  ORF type:complete len:346 (-),score=32.97 TRINITY_DN13108_c0_g1_i1:252-1289(-)
MQIEKGRRNGKSQFLSDRDDVSGAVRSSDVDSTMSSSFLLSPSPSSGLNYIEHRVSKMDTLAGVAIKYGVEVSDIKRLNGLVTDLQMFAHKSLQIPLPGRHPPSPILSNGSAGPGESSAEQTPPRRPHHDVLDTFQSLKLKAPQRRVSPAMNCLQGYYGLKPPTHKATTEGTEMAVYRTTKSHYLEDGPFPKTSPVSEPLPNWHRKSISLVNGLLPENGDSACHTPELLLKEESGNGFSGITGKGLALRPKSASRAALTAELDSGRPNPFIPTGDSFVSDGLAGVRKSSSTSNLQDPENGSSIWPTSKWTLKPDLQALSTAAITRPIFDGLPKPITGRRHKAALD